jgi:hypothetical protein
MALWKLTNVEDVSTTMCGRKKKLNHESAELVLIKANPGRYTE